MKQSNLQQFKRILHYTKGYRWLILIAFIAAILYVSATLYSPKLIGDAVDKFVDKETFSLDLILPYVIELGIIVVLGAVFGWVMNYLLNKVTYSIVKDLRVAAFNKILNVRISYLDSHLSGDLLTRIILDTDQVSEGLLQGLAQALTGFITIIVTIVMMLTIRWEIGLVVIVLTPLSLFVAAFISKRNFKTFKDQAEIKGEIGSFLNEMLTNQKLVKAYRQEEANVNTFKEIDKRLYYIGAKAQFNSSLVNPSTRFVNALVYAVVATFGAILIGQDKLSFGVGGLTAFLTYASQYTKPFNEISGVAAELSNAFASLRRVFELIDEEEMPNEANLDTLAAVKGNVRFVDVNFSYVKNKPVIEDFNIDIKAGSKVAIVGPTGCGKTTIINLLMRFYEVNSGQIMLDEQDIKTISKESLRAQIGMVLQDTWLFKGTVYENIAYGKSGATLAEVIEAAQKAHAVDFIEKLPNGFNTVVSDDSLSLGQKQLLCIARLMLRLPNILILDEATSNIDTRTEINVQKAFHELMKGKTAFIIAHRLSTIRTADLILVMKDGQIIEKGTHDELLSNGGFYKQLYEAQFA